MAQNLDEDASEDAEPYGEEDQMVDDQVLEELEDPEKIEVQQDLIAMFDMIKAMHDDKFTDDETVK